MVRIPCSVDAAAMCHRPPLPLAAGTMSAMWFFPVCRTCPGLSQPVPVPQSCSDICRHCVANKAQPAKSASQPASQSGGQSLLLALSIHDAAAVRKENNRRPGCQLTARNNKNNHNNNTAKYHLEPRWAPSWSWGHEDFGSSRRLE
jgi:hypothetical protein